MRLESKRLLLRKFQKKDINDYFEYVTHPDVGPRAGWEPYTDRQKAIERIEVERAKPLQFAIVLKSENKMIGSIEVMDVKPDRINETYNTNNSKEIGIILNPKYWGQGYMTEAIGTVLDMCFNKLKLDNIYAGYFEPNIGSRRVQEKNGFVPIGRVHNYAKWYQTGKMVDLILMRITSDEYKRFCLAKKHKSN